MSMQEYKQQTQGWLNVQELQPQGQALPVLWVVQCDVSYRIKRVKEPGIDQSTAHAKGQPQLHEVVVDHGGVVACHGT